MVDTANPEGTSAECSLKAIPNTPKRLSILPGIIILTVLKQNLQTGATSVGLTAANRWDEAGVVGCEYHVQRGRFGVSFGVSSFYRQARPGAHEQSLMPVPIQAELDTGGCRGVIDGSLGTWYGRRI